MAHRSSVVGALVFGCSGLDRVIEDHYIVPVSPRYTIRGDVDRGGGLPFAPACPFHDWVAVTGKAGTKHRYTVMERIKAIFFPWPVTFVGTVAGGSLVAPDSGGFEGDGARPPSPLGLPRLFLHVLTVTQHRSDTASIVPRAGIPAIGLIPSARLWTTWTAISERARVVRFGVKRSTEAPGARRPW